MHAYIRMIHTYIHGYGYTHTHLYIYTMHEKMTLLSASALARQAPQSASTVRLANALLQRPPPAKYMFVGFHIYLCISQEPRRVPAPCVLLAVGKYGPVGSTSSVAPTCTSCPAGKFQATAGVVSVCVRGRF